MKAFAGGLSAAPASSRDLSLPADPLARNLPGPVHRAAPSADLGSAGKLSASALAFPGLSASGQSLVPGRGATG